MDELKLVKLRPMPVSVISMAVTSLLNIKPGYIRGENHHCTYSRAAAAVDDKESIASLYLKNN